MAKFTITIPAELEAGISAAREAYNAGLPEKRDEEGNVIANPDALGTDSAYVNFVMKGAAESYAKQFEPEAAKATRLATLEQENATLKVENTQLKAARV